MELEETTCLSVYIKNKAMGMVHLNKGLMPRTIFKIKTKLLTEISNQISPDADLVLVAAVIDNEIWEFLTSNKYKEIRENRSMEAAIYQITAECIFRIKTEVPVNKRIEELRSWIIKGEEIEEYTAVEMVPA